MEVSFECPICLEEYTPEFKPLILPCGHNACFECLNGLVENTNLMCPTCRVTHTHINVNGLTINYALIPSNPGQNKGNTSKQYLLDHMHTIQSQLDFLRKAESTLKNDYDLAQNYNRRCKTDFNDKIELLIATLQNFKKKSVTLIEEYERNNEIVINQRFGEIDGKIESKNSLMTELNKAYHDDSDLSLQSKVALRNLNDLLSFATSL